LVGEIAEVRKKLRALEDENGLLKRKLEALESRKGDMEQEIDMGRKALTKAEESKACARKSEDQAVLKEQQVRQLLDDREKQCFELESEISVLKVELSQSATNLEKTRNKAESMQQRCDVLSKECSLERKAKIEMERCMKVAKKKAEPACPSGGDGGADATMLGMTLNMLRCSVCKDRFKDVVITRCFHLFCSQCTEENLKNRHRKCPACGEKFGSDDVQKVYFTH
jgi:E3 ubiquitin-protein ligase BRE1